jgi:xanthine dehydrogenase/oxidase
LQFKFLNFIAQWSGACYNSFVAIYNSDGSVAIAHGGVESGQGINTKAAQVVAYELGIPVDLINVRKPENLISANSITTGGSITSELVCQVNIFLS